MVNFIGVDYGSKLAGTTVICWLENDALQLAQSEKKKDADLFLSAKIEALKTEQVFIDAPLSLPLVYTQPDKAEDYFYRKADRTTKAMSPMFLGGLTARAMRLKNSFNQKNVVFREIYPSYFVREVLKKPISYNKKDPKSIPLFLAFIQQELPADQITPIPSNWHQIDAVLAWWSGWRFQKNVHLTLGNELEGEIVV